MAILFADDSNARDPLKYRWLPPDLPRIPRERPMTYVKFWLILAALLSTVAGELMLVRAVATWLGRVAG